MEPGNQGLRWVTQEDRSQARNRRFGVRRGRETTALQSHSSSTSVRHLTKSDSEGAPEHSLYSVVIFISIRAGSHKRLDRSLLQDSLVDMHAQMWHNERTGQSAQMEMLLGMPLAVIPAAAPLVSEVLG
jgi:hypothetical protein